MALPYPPGEALTCQQIRELDVLAIEHVGVPGIVLMENAGRRCAEVIHRALVHPRGEQVLVLCGSGNNGGDGFVAARHLHNSGVPVTVALAAAPARVRGDAAVNLRILERMGLPFLPAYEPGGLAQAEAVADRAAVIVDALLGTGSSGELRAPMAALVRTANAARRARRIAIDLPSGLNADTGEPHEPCFRADATVTMVAAKVGFEAPAARSFVGRVVVVDIGVPRELIPGRGKIAPAD